MANAATAELQRSDEYRRARLMYAARNYAGAMRALDQLLRAPGMNPECRIFLLRQRDICLRQRGAGRIDPQAKGVPPPLRVAEQADCGPRALALVCDKLGVRTSVPSLRKLAGTTGSGTTLAGMEKAAHAVGLKAEGVQMDRAALSQLGSPAVAWVDGDHFVAVLSVAGDEATVHDPNHTGEEVMKTEDLLRRSGGILLMLSR